MAELTPAQRATADAMIAGTFDKIGAAPAYMSPPTSVAEMYKGIYPPAAPKPTYQAGMTGRGLPATAAGSPYMTAAEKAKFQQTYGKDVMAAFAPQPPTSPAVTAATQMAQGVPLPRPRPGSAPNWMDLAAMQPVGANPGMGGAMIGDGQMAHGIPPQGPPPPGVAPTVWAGGNPMTGGVGPQRSASAPIMRPADRYSLQNLAGQQAALQRQAQATGQTGVYRYEGGQRVGTVGGGTGADAYARAAARSVDRGTGGEGGNPTWW